MARKEPAALPSLVHSTIRSAGDRCTAMLPGDSSSQAPLSFLSEHDALVNCAPVLSLVERLRVCMGLEVIDAQPEATIRVRNDKTPIRFFIILRVKPRPLGLPLGLVITHILGANDSRTLYFRVGGIPDDNFFHEPASRDSHVEIAGHIERFSLWFAL
jgi:hypothetical protein